MRMQSNNFESLDYRKPPFKNVFTIVQKRLAKEHDRVISADAVNKAYRRGDKIVFKLVKEEVEKCIQNFETELLTKKSTLNEKRKFENEVSLRISAIEV